MISAQVIADSKNEFGNRLTTMVVTFPRIILAEFNTHRMFSRNSASSRAIPFKKMLETVTANPFIPIAFQKDHKGMQGTEYLNEAQTKMAREDIQTMLFKIAPIVRAQHDMLGVTKQVVNRYLEPFMWHTVIVTATEWENFFALRCPQYQYNEGSAELSKIFRSKKDLLNFLKENDELAYINVSQYNEISWLKLNKGQAEIHMMALAEAMWDAYNESIPKELKAGEWHIPFGDQIDLHRIIELNRKEDTGQPLREILTETDKLLKEWLVKIATARCARISYTVVGEEGKPDNYENDIKLHDRLLASGHMSPFEHCAKAMNDDEYHSHCNSTTLRVGDDDCGKIIYEQYINGMYKSENLKSTDFGWSGNFRGFVQYRKMIPNENKV